MRKVTAILQARMGSSRLSGKVLMEVLGRPLLGYEIERLRLCERIGMIVLATTDRPLDDKVAALGERLGVKVFRGPEDDVLERYYRAAVESGADHVMRVTGDCPLIAPEICDRVVEEYFANDADYAVTSQGFAEGLDCEVLSMEALRLSREKGTLPSEREHVTQYVRKHPDLFRLHTVQSGRDDGQLRLTVDEPEDFEVVRGVIENLYPRYGASFPFDRVRECLLENPSLSARNRHIERNEGLKRSLRQETPEILYVRADASRGIGIGHVMRCLALGQAWIGRGGECVLVGSVPEKLRERLESAGMRVAPVAEGSTGSGPVEPLAERDSWVVLDGYGFDNGDAVRLKEAGCRVLYLDDMALLDRYDADLVLNQNPHAGQFRYALGSGELLLGPRFALLREEFLGGGPGNGNVAADGLRLLISFGGSDPSGTSRVALDALDGVPSRLAVTVVLGPEFGGIDEIRAAAGRSKHSVELVHAPSDMAGLMRTADIAVCPASVTSLEFAALGVPTIAVTVADNQEGIAAALERQGVAVDAGRRDAMLEDRIAKVCRMLAADGEKRRAMADAGRRYVDGRGARRVAERMSPTEISLRPVTADDCEACWKLANDPVARKASFCTGAIPWEEHCRWFEAMLQNGDRRVVAAENRAGVLVGTARFDLSDGETVVSVNLVPEFRGLGLGPKVIGMACGEMAGQGGNPVVAYVKPENAPSLSAFARAGFSPAGTEEVQGVRVQRLIFGGVA